MFDYIGNMPLHPLVLHAVVVGVPLTMLLALLFALPRFRNWARWPMLLACVGSLVVTFVAKQSGESLVRQLKLDFSSPAGALIQVHAKLADQLFLIMIGVAVLGVANAFFVRRPTDGAQRSGAVSVILPLLLVLAAVAATVWVIRVGDLGSRAVWNPTDVPAGGN